MADNHGVSKVALALFAIVAGTGFLFIYGASNGEFFSDMFSNRDNGNRPADEPDAAEPTDNAPQTAPPAETALPENTLVSGPDVKSESGNGNPEPSADSKSLPIPAQDSIILQDSVQETTTQAAIEDALNSNNSDVSSGEKNTTVSEIDRLAFSYAMAVSLQPEAGIGISSSFDGVLQTPPPWFQIDDSYPSLPDDPIITDESARDDRDDEDDNNDISPDIDHGKVTFSAPESVPKAIIEDPIIPDLDEDLAANNEETKNDDQDLAPDDAEQDGTEDLDEDKQDGNDGDDQEEKRKDKQDNGKGNGGKGNGEKGNKGKGHDKKD